MPVKRGREYGYEQVGCTSPRERSTFRMQPAKNEEGIIF